jgi:hypothetical protein
MHEEDDNRNGDFLKIDELHLDREWLDQPLLIHEYSVKLADARKHQDLAKQELDLTEAELNQSVRRASSKLEEKVTEAAIKAAVMQHETYTKAQKKLIRARHAVDVLQAATTAIEHRKRALTMLVELHGQNYFSSPRATSNERLKEVADKGIARNAAKKPRQVSTQKGGR